MTLCMVSALEAQTSPSPTDTTQQQAQLPPITVSEETQEEEKKEHSFLYDRKLIIDYKTWSIRLVKQEH